MRSLWRRLRNKMVSDDAYLDVSTQLGDELGNEPIFAALREFSSAPVQPSPVPVLLLEAFNASQKRISRRRKVRAGTGALFGVAILVPSLAYAGALPSPVSRLVQHVFNVISLPIQIPSITTPSPSLIKPGSVESTPSSAPSSTNEAPDGEQSQSPNEMPTVKPSSESSAETNSTSDSESASVASSGNSELGQQSLLPPLDSQLSGSGDSESDSLPPLSSLSGGSDGSQTQSSPSAGSGETDQIDGN